MPIANTVPNFALARPASAPAKTMPPRRAALSPCSSESPVQIEGWLLLLVGARAMESPRDNRESLALGGLADLLIESLLTCGEGALAHFSSLLSV